MKMEKGQYVYIVMGKEGPECRMKADIDLFPSQPL